MTPSIWQILIVVLVIVLLFGAGRVPRLMEDIGKGINAFKKGLKDEPPKALDQSAAEDDKKSP